ncbi:hypothetical protein LTR97_009462 [Elasticomyces elasticus]|uniref:Uncharacterized protein n=1 Tax=Elasticomyces elasticus TaxID=574655 RepID=A0AAN7W6L0_9PEZI|nr:hypothetical protein LTR97_009462 [Elasticomyces elasticus]
MVSVSASEAKQTINLSCLMPTTELAKRVNEIFDNIPEAKRPNSQPDITFEHMQSILALMQMLAADYGPSYSLSTSGINEDDEDEIIDEDLAAEYDLTDGKCEVAILDPKASTVVNDKPVSTSIFAMIKPIASKQNASKQTRDYDSWMTFTLQSLFDAAKLSRKSLSNPVDLADFLASENLTVRLAWLRSNGRADRHSVVQKALSGLLPRC